MSLSEQRDEMVRRFIEPVTADERIRQAFREVPRHLFVPEEFRSDAYENSSLPLGFGQTISQPSLVARMTSLLHLTGSEKVLEIGTGSGYQAAILSLLANEVWSVERMPNLAAAAQHLLAQLGYTVTVVEGNGSLGLPEQAPFQAVIVTASGPQIPPALVEQLADGGRILLPVRDAQEGEVLAVGQKVEGELAVKPLEPVRFVPLIGSAGFEPVDDR